MPATAAIPLGYFGVGVPAPPQPCGPPRPHPPPVSVIVSRGGRPDLAGPRLARVQAPTLLIVGSADRQVLDLNRRAQKQLTSENRLEDIPGATHSFEEQGALQRVADLAQGWSTSHFARLVP